MKKGWTRKTLEEVCQFRGGGTPSKAINRYWSGDIPWVSPKDMKFDVVSDSIDHISHEAIDGSATSLIPKDSVLMVVRSGILARIVPIAITGRPLTINQDLKALCPNRGMDARFLYHLLHSKMDELLATVSRGATVHRLMTDQIRALEFFLPPLPEQQRIVRILDEAFAAIAVAKANTEKNLQNARALFESHLNAVFTQKGEGWEPTTLGEEVDLLAGFAFKSAQYTEKESDVRLLRGDNIHQAQIRWDEVKRWPANDTKDYDRYHLNEGDVVLAMDRPWVKAGLKHATIATDDLPCLLVQRTARLRGGPNLENRFLKILIGSMGFTSHILGAQTGIGVPHISGQQIKDFEFARPPLPGQRRIADNLETLRSETQRLTRIYDRKIAALEELKKSLLHQAFSGKLTAAVQEVVQPPVKPKTLSTTDLHAGIIAWAYQLHEGTKHESTFGHVKMEKMAHMVEAHFGIDLGREPVKDAAGPNDYPHLKKVEHRAKNAGFFLVQRAAPNRYHCRKLRAFDEIVEKAKAELLDILPQIEQLLSLMVPMETKQAEIVATLYAAWNNLLLDGKRPTEEEIVLEARENWHPDKLDIERKRFFAGIEWMRNKGLVPTGKGKRVAEKRG